MARAVTVVGRRAESAEIERFLDALRDGSRCLVLEGEVGIGKTTLLNWARASASERGYRVLSANPVESEVPWEFTALADLLQAVPQAVFKQLSYPQRRALGVAVFKDDLPDIPVDGRTLASGVVKALALLAAETPVVLAVDDLPWLDAPSARVLSYLLRRAGDNAVGLLGTIRTDWSTDREPVLTDSVEADRVKRVEVGPISAAGLRELLAERSERALGRAGLARLHELSRGNPLFALELVKENALGLAGVPGGSSSVPESLRRLVRRRIGPLSPGARDVLLVGALSGEPSLAVVFAATADPLNASSDYAQVVDGGIVVPGGDTITFVHPLICSVIAGEATREQRRAAHRRLAVAVRHHENRARHLALGAEGPDEQVAQAVEDAAISAAARGACETAATLAGLAVSLTPPDRIIERQRRIAGEAEYCFEASEPARACTLLEAIVDDVAPGPRRAELLRRLSRYSTHRGDPFAVWVTRLAMAIDESGDDVGLRASIAFELASAAANAGDRAVSDEYGPLALRLAVRAGDAALEARICAGLAVDAFFKGEGVRRDLVQRGLSAAEQPTRVSMELRPRVALGHVLRLSGDLDAARVLFGQEYQHATEEGVETELPLLLWGLVEVEAWAGNWRRAEELCAEGSGLAEGGGSPPGIALMAAVRGLLHVYRGRIDEGLADGQLAMATSMAIGFPFAALTAAQALGLAGLSIGDPAATHERLTPIAEMVRAGGIPEPGMLRFLPDEIEALIRLGELGSAEELLDPFGTRAAELGRAWAMATSARCRALLLAARGDLVAAEAAIDRCLELHSQLGMPFEHGRSLLVAGETYRRARRKKRAAEVLESAASIFGDLGAPLWEQRAREEAGRIGLRVAARGAAGSELTEAERRVADLVAAGSSNAEVAAQLFMGQRTVEAHLQVIYRKLGVNSRLQLSRVHPPSLS